MKKLMAAVLAAICLVLSLATASAVTAADMPRQKTVRVGYLIYKGFQDGTGDNPKSGYGYEYLQEIAYAANWKYEYVYGGFNELLQKLERGEIDVMGNVSMTPERALLVSYPKHEQGREQYYLYVREDNTQINANDPSTLNGKRIGVNKGSFQEALFKQWLQDNNVQCELIPYSNGNKRNEDVLNGIIDATVSNIIMDNIQQKMHLRALFQTGSSSYYIAINKNRPDLLADLNAAQLRLLNYDWYYNERVFLKYYGDNSVTLSNLSIEDKQWIEQKGSFTVGYLDGLLPFSSWNPKKNTLLGILAVYKEHVQKRYGIDIKTKPYSTYDELRQALDNGEVDSIYPFFCNYWSAEKNGLMVTPSLTNNYLVMLYKGNYNDDTTTTIAAARKNSLQQFFIRTYYPNAKIITVDDVNDCIKAVLSGQAKSTVLSSDTYYANRNTLENLDECDIINTGFSAPIGFAVRKGNIAAFSFMKHSMTGLLPSDISKAMLEGGYAIPEPSISQFFQRHLGLTIMLVIIITVAIFGFLSYYVLSKQRLLSLNRHNFELNKKIYVDFATGLPNKNKCEDMIASPAPVKKPTACAMFDLNELKLINDTKGHEMGDMIIYTFASLLRKAVPAKYFVGRFGGDEFILIAEGIHGNEEFCKILQNIAEQIDSFNQTSRDFQLSYAHGYALSEEHPGLNIQQLLQLADQQMYVDKKACKSARCSLPNR